MPPLMQSREAVFIESIKSRRLHLGWTQTDLARAMRERGFPFHQQTIQRIEDGRRPVRLDEAFAFADIFGTDVHWLATSARGLRQRDINTGLFAIADLLDGLSRGEDAAWKSLVNLREAVRFLAEKEGRRPSDRLLAGAALLGRLSAAISSYRVNGLRDVTDEMLEATNLVVADDGVTAAELREGGYAEGEDDERAATLQALGLVKVPPRFRAMPLDRLIELYVGQDDEVEA